MKLCRFFTQRREDKKYNSLFAYCSFFIITLNLFCLINQKQTQTTIEPKYSGSQVAFDFPLNAEWINTNKPLSIKNLKGKIILLYFWKPSCINCIHTLVDLKKLEKQWKEELVLIGINSPKFLAEKNNDNLIHSILQNELEHAIIHDPNFLIWGQYQINAWPSFVLIDPKGLVFGIQSGEDIYEGFNQIISGMVEEYKKLNLISSSPISSLKPIVKSKSKQLLSFPGKLTLNDIGSELFVSDSKHHRILRIDIKTKKIIDIIGNEKSGLIDGNFKEAKFNNPQGLTIKNEFIYVADSENHCIREINLKTKKVKTLAGTGLQARSFNVPGKGKEVSFNSPWDLIEQKNKLYITMKGSHQIWTLDLQTYESEVYAGSGSENLFDGKLQESSFAQPSGITKSQGKFFITDSEISAIRSIDFKYSELVSTIIGKGLFEFGDVDDSYPIARLQYPTGIYYNNGNLYVADTYNNKIKLVNPYEKTSTTLAGNGKIGSQNGSFVRFSVKINSLKVLGIYPYLTPKATAHF